VKRAKPPKKKKPIIDKQLKTLVIKQIEKHKDELRKESMDELVNLTLPVMMLAVKDELHATPEQLERISKRMDRYLNYIGDRQTTIEDVHRLLEGGHEM